MIELICHINIVSFYSLQLTTEVKMNFKEATETAVEIYCSTYSSACGPISITDGSEQYVYTHNISCG